MTTVRPEIDELLGRTGGVATRARLLRVVTRNQLDHEVRTGRLLTPFPGAFCRPWDADIEAVLHRAALTSVGPPAALSHLTALQHWQLIAGRPEDIHVAVPASRAPRSRPGLTLHRVARFPRVVRVEGLIVVTPAEAVVSSWPLLPGDERRSPAIAMLRRRLDTAQHLRAAIEVSPRLAGRRELDHLVDLLDSGCESELELWGHLSVFDAPGLRHGVRQLVVRAGRRRYRLDLGFELERVAVEMDGRAFHSSDEQRERDIRRDAALATTGWLTLRYSHRRLHRDPAGCRRDTLAVLATRRR